MPEQPKPILFRLPSGETIEVYVVELSDGRMVARRREELVELPRDLRLPPADEPGP